MTDFDLVEPVQLDRSLVDYEEAYRPFHARPTSDAEWTERIMTRIANPSMFGAMPGADPMAGEIARLRGVDPPINNLGDEMVFLAAGPFAGRAIPIAIRAMGSGTAAFRGLTAEAEQALTAYGRSMMNRLGRMPTADEVLEYLKIGRHVIEGVNHAIQHSSASPQPVSQDQQPDWASPNARWDVDASGQAVAPPNNVAAPSDLSSADAIADLDRLFQWIVSEAQERTGAFNDGLRGLGGRSFQTYLKDHIVLPKHYVGRTSGFESPERNVRERSRKMHPSADFEDAVLDQSSKLYSAIRGREEMVEKWLRAQGMSANRNNPINPLNPLRDYYLRNAEREFGPMPPLPGARQ